MGSAKVSSSASKINLLLVTGITFLFVGIFTVNLYSGNPLSKNEPHSTETLGISTQEPPLVEQLPKYIGDGTSLEIFSKAALAIDTDSGTILYEKNPQMPVMPASTVKVITALVALDSYNLDQKIITPSVTVEGTKMGLTAGEVISVNDLLYGLLVASANDAAEVLAYVYPGGRNLFVAQMNTKAQSLGLRNSVFVNPTGLDEDGQTTTAQDLVKASFYAMQNPEFKKIVGTKRYNVVGSDGEITHKLNNINQLLGVVEGVKGVKTGKTEGAMENLITYIERDESGVMIALLGSTDRFADTVKTIDWIYNNFSWKD